MSQRRRIDELFAQRPALLSRPPGPADNAMRLRELRSWQASRLAGTYADLRADVHYARAIEFFLSDLYGPHDFAQRDQQLRRAWRFLKRALPAMLLDILARTVELQLLTAELDAAMAEALAPGPISQASYAAAYCAVGQRAQRMRQIDLIIGVGRDLEHIVRHAWVGRLLRAAHLPAHAAGCGVLQDLLERGYAAFAEMPCAGRLMQLIRQRETQLLHELYSGINGPRAMRSAAAPHAAK